MAHPKQWNVERCGSCDAVRMVLNPPWIRWARKELGLSLQDVAEMAGLQGINGRIYISSLEGGKRPISKRMHETFLRLGDLLDKKRPRRTGALKK